MTSEAEDLSRRLDDIEIALKDIRRILLNEIEGLDILPPDNSLLQELYDDISGAEEDRGYDTKISRWIHMLKEEHQITDRLLRDAFANIDLTTPLGRDVAQAIHFHLEGSHDGHSS
jgi:hypothetical protein